MKRGSHSRLIALFIVLIMALSLCVSPVLASADGALSKIVQDEKAAVEHRTLMLDCGRKYYTKDWIVALITEMSAAGYNELCLAFGNDGLRFLLDDMAVGTYSHDAVTNAIVSGNTSYSANNGNTEPNALTQAEMDEIIAAATAQGIEIVPLLNMPGHMDTVVYAMGVLGIANAGYNGSESSVSFLSDDAVAFAKALAQKYMEYFAQKGCRYFNIGADEYANDIYSSGGMGFGHLVSTGRYGLYVDFVNALAAQAKALGMMPRAFNDGIYYANQSVTFDTDIQICYWSSGWSGYSVASASYVRAQGHSMINTNGDFYYVLGKTDQFDSGYSYAANFSNTAFMGSTISDPVGAMFCVWGDYPAAETEQEVAAKIRMPLRAMAARMNDLSIGSISTGVVTGGFNADGTINVPETTPTPTATLDATSEPTPVATPPLNYIYDDGTGVGVGSNDVASVTVTAATAPAIPDSADAVAYDVTPAYADGTPYTGAAEVDIPIPSGWTYDVSRIRGFVVEADGTSALIPTVSIEGGAYRFTAPHFSVVGVAVMNEVTNVVDVPLVSGGTYTIDLDAPAELTVAPDAGIATITGPETIVLPGGNVRAADAATTLTSGAQYIISSGTNALAVDGTSYTDAALPGAGELVDDALLWTFTAVDGSTNEYTISTVIGGTTYYLYSSGDNLSLSTTSRAWTYANNRLSYTTTVLFWQTTRYLRYSGTAWTCSTSTNGATLAMYPVEQQEGGTLYRYTITGVAAGATSATLGGTVYNITVIDAPPTDALTGSSVTVEYWITNARAQTAAGAQNYVINATDANAATEAGIVLADVVAQNVAETGNTNRTAVYWRTRALDTTEVNTIGDGTGAQTANAYDDETLNGSPMARIRYVNGYWQYSADGVTWAYVRTIHQLVAYYLQDTGLAQEIDIYAADWGYNNGAAWGWGNDPGYCSASYQLVYPDGTTVPASTAIADLSDKTTIFGFWTGGRGIGTVLLSENDLGGYEIYRVTSETGTFTYTQGSNYAITINAFTWDANETDVWDGVTYSDDGNHDIVVANHARSPRTDGYYSNLMWDANRDAILIRIYIRPKVSDLTVHYREGTPADYTEFYSFGIDTSYNNLPNTFAAFGTQVIGNELHLTNNTVQNALGVMQTVPYDLTDATALPEIGDRYASGFFIFTEMDMSADSTELYLYYNIDSSRISKIFVLDYGMPVTITPADFGITDAGNVQSVALSSTGALNLTGAYGRVVVDQSSSSNTPDIIYTLSRGFLGREDFSIHVTYRDGTTNVLQVAVIPATNILYEETFMTFTSGGYGQEIAWSLQGVAQAQPQSSANALYGYDAIYAAMTGDGMGASRVTTVTNAMYEAIRDNPDAGYTWPSSAFTFFGTGLDIVSRSAPDTGLLFIDIVPADPSNTTLSEKHIVVDTYCEFATLNQVPVYHCDDLVFGQYNVTVTAVYLPFFDHTVTLERAGLAETYDFAAAVGAPAGTEYEFVSVNDNSGVTPVQGATRATGSYNLYIDGIRIYNPGGTVTPDGVTAAGWYAYGEAGERNPDYIQLRDVLIDPATWNSSAEGTLFIDSYNQATQEVNVATYANIGPNHEVYLTNGNGIAFTVSGWNATTMNLHVSAKAPAGSVVMYVNGHAITVSSTTELYFDIGDYVNATTGSVVITCSAAGAEVLSLMNLKLVVTDGTEASVIADADTLLFAEAVLCGVRGDANHDGIVNASDALHILRCMLGMCELDVYGVYCADMDDDGRITVQDAMLILRELLAQRR
ncbi:MAG: family 20 glycosylhydrolase [Clostridia bacterium]|nr:family 20 glycosylhydrolase [Clostridia bacterium]